MKLFFYLLLLILLHSCYQVNRDCSDFKTGTFEFTYVQDGKEKTGRFIRSESYTIEYYDKNVDTSSVRWINDCEFITKKLHPTDAVEEKAIHMKILSTADDSYSFEYKYAIKQPNKKEHVVRGVAKKLK